MDLTKVLMHLFRRKVKIVFGFASNKKMVLIKDLNQVTFEQKLSLVDLKTFHPKS